jgi:hypothetical protein
MAAEFLQGVADQGSETGPRPNTQRARALSLSLRDVAGPINGRDNLTRVF